MPATLLPRLADPGQPAALFDALEARLQEVVGFRLFTLLFVYGSEVARINSSDPEAYPVSGRKPMSRTPWGDHVLHAQKPWLGRTMKDIEWAFFDHELIASLGCGCCINLPVIYDGQVIGTMNLLDAEHRYGDTHLEAARPFAPLAVPAFLAARQGAGAAPLATPED